MADDEDLNAAPSLILAILLFGIAYAIVRYHIAGTVPWKDLPFFILNKGISLSAFILLACNFSFGPLHNLGLGIPESWLNSRRALGMTGFLLVLIHTLMSLMLFTPDVYGKFFEGNGTITLLAGLSMLTGVLGFVVLGGLHLLFMGYEGWLNPGGWQGGLPPVSLLAFILFLVGYMANLLGRK